MSDGSATTEPTTALESFIETTTDALASLGTNETTLKAVDAAGDELVEAVTAQHERISELETRVDTLESELTTERETRAKEAAEDRQRLFDLETRLDDVTTDADAESTADPSAAVDTGSTPATPGVQPPKTPLEDIVRVPEHLVEESLTANQRRARFVAKDVYEYTKRVPAGRAIKSSELRRVLTAGEDARIYTETVSRVIEFLDDLGGEAVQVRDSNAGERVVVFTEAFVERVRAYRRHGASNTVVTGVETAR